VGKTDGRETQRKRGRNGGKTRGKKKKPPGPDAETKRSEAEGGVFKRKRNIDDSKKNQPTMVAVDR